MPDWGLLSNRKSSRRPQQPNKAFRTKLFSFRKDQNPTSFRKNQYTMQAFPQQPWTAEAVASLPPPGLSAPSQIAFSPPLTKRNKDMNKNHKSPHKRYLSYITSPPAVIRTARSPPALYRPLTTGLYPTPHNANKAQPILSSSQQQQQQAYTASTSSNPQQQRQQPKPNARGAGTSLPNANNINENNNTPDANAAAAASAHPQERVVMSMDLTNVATSLSPAGPMLVMARQKRRLQLGKKNTTSTNDTAKNNAHNNNTNHAHPLHQHPEKITLEERLRRERQRISASAGSLTQYSWTWTDEAESKLRILIPSRGNLYVQDGIPETDDEQDELLPRCIHDKTIHGPAIDPQLSPDGSMVAWSADGEIFVQSCGDELPQGIPQTAAPIQITFGAMQSTDTCIRHGVADFVAQEEMDRYRGFWWHPDSTGILFVRLDESAVPPFRILHHDAGMAGGDNAVDPYHSPFSSAIPYEDHRYPFAGKENPAVQLAFVQIDRDTVMQNGLLSPSLDTSLERSDDASDYGSDDNMEVDKIVDSPVQARADELWADCTWFDSPREASEYLARVYWLPDGSVAAQWQNRAQNVAVLARLDLDSGKTRTLLTERSDDWINLHHMFKVLPDPIHPDDCIATEKQIPPIPNPPPPGSFSFLYASERTGFQHLYLYTFVPGIHGEQAIPIRAISSGNWMVESIVGVNVEKDVVYITGTHDSPLERHLYALPLLNRRLNEQESSPPSLSDDSSNGVRRGFSKVMNALSGKGGSRNSKLQEAIWSSAKPVRITIEPGMHSIVMDEECDLFVDTSSDLDRPTSSRLYQLPSDLWSGQAQLALTLICTLFDAIHEDNSLAGLNLNQPTLDGLPSGAKLLASLPPPELITFPTSDGSETLHAAVYRPNPRLHGPGPYPLICAVYGGPHVQRVNRSWSQCADMRAQRLRSLGFCVVKCDNRGSSRRGMAFEASISRRLGRLEVLDQVAAVRQLTLRGIVDPSRVGVYGWSYGGYLAAMCLARAPDVFRCGVAGAPVTSWDGYDTHYTERYMGHPTENGPGYRESAVFDHVPNIRGKLMIVHGLLDENVHFRHTARLINKLVASGKDYELLLFPEERHSPRRLRDRIYMEQRISDFFLEQMCSLPPPMAMLAASISQKRAFPIGGNL